MKVVDIHWYLFEKKSTVTPVIAVSYKTDISMIPFIRHSPASIVKQVVDFQLRIDIKGTTSGEYGYVVAFTIKIRWSIHECIPLHKVT